MWNKWINWQALLFLFSSMALPWLKTVNYLPLILHCRRIGSWQNFKSYPLLSLCLTPFFFFLAVIQTWKQHSRTERELNLDLNRDRFEFWLHRKLYWVIGFTEPHFLHLFNHSVCKHHVGAGLRAGAQKVENPTFFFSITLVFKKIHSSPLPFLFGNHQLVL